MPILAILWARRLIVATALLSCLAGGLVVLTVSPPYYRATARVIMNYIKPDPTTGSYMSSKNVDAYVASQIGLIRDYQTAGPAAELLGWLDSPELQIQYAARPISDTREFRNWVGARLIPGISAHRVEDSNMLEIGFRGSSPQVATQIVEAVRQAYIDQNVQTRRSQAEGSAQKLTSDSQRTRDTIARLEAEKKAYEKLSNVLLADGRHDTDSIRMRQLALALPRYDAPRQARTSTAAQSLEEVDQRLARARDLLGPNHPTVQGLMRQRETLVTQVQMEQAHTQSIAQSIIGLGQAKGAMLDAQKKKVLDQRQHVLQLNLMQDEIDRQHKLLKSALDQIATLRQLAGTNESGLASVGVAEAGPRPVFPNPALILSGSSILGMIFGSLFAIFIELLDRRVRSTQDLQLAAGAPILGVVPKLRVGPSRRRIRLGAPQSRGRAWFGKPVTG